jgi:hypothetical protein
VSLLGVAEHNALVAEGLITMQHNAQRKACHEHRAQAREHVTYYNCYLGSGGGIILGPMSDGHWDVEFDVQVGTDERDPWELDFVEDGTEGLHTVSSGIGDVFNHDSIGRKDDSNPDEVAVSDTPANAQARSRSGSAHSRSTSPSLTPVKRRRTRRATMPRFVRSVAWWAQSMWTLFEHIINRMPENPGVPLRCESFGAGMGTEGFAYKVSWTSSGWVRRCYCGCYLALPKACFRLSEKNIFCKRFSIIHNQFRLSRAWLAARVELR